MKKKPDITGFSAQKNPSAFLESGAADLAEKPREGMRTIADVVSPVKEPIKPEPTIQKLFRFRWDTANAIKLSSAQQSIATGKRVTETEIVETLIRAYYKLDS